MAEIHAWLRDAVVHPARRWRRLAQARTMARIDSARFDCPVCGYHGIFIPVGGPLGMRKYGLCPACGAFERHRLEAKVLEKILAPFDPAQRSCLHFAPEPGLANLLRRRFGEYHTSELTDTSADIVGDLRDLPIPGASYDFVLASAILEHIQEDRLAMAEIYRILKPGGMAVLYVPIVADATIEYPEPVESEDFHVRAPGTDYFDRCREFFDAVRVFTSADFSERNQLYIYEDRSHGATANTPYRKPMLGERHLDYVAVCLKEPCDIARREGSGGRLQPHHGTAGTILDLAPAE